MSMKILHLFNFFFFISFFTNGLCNSYIHFPNKFSIPIPPSFDPNFHGRAFILVSGKKHPPTFRAGLSLEPIPNNLYSCSLSVFLGPLKVWSSDHFSPFSPSTTCVLDLTSNGVLQVHDGFGLVGWQTSTFSQQVQRLLLEKTGNLVLKDDNNCTKWQSFDYPTDTMLRGQQLNAPFSLTSLNYSFEVLQDMLRISLNWRGQRYSYWELEPKRNISFARLGSIGLKLFDRNSTKVAVIKGSSLSGKEPNKLLALKKDGNLGLYYYSAETGELQASYQSSNNNTCQLPLPCGNYGICTSSNSCSCVAFVSINGDVYDFCENGNEAKAKMVALHGVDTVLMSSNSSLKLMNVSEDECVSSCMDECSCVAARHNEHYSVCMHYGLVGGVREVERGGGHSYWVKVLEEKEKGGSGFERRVVVGAGVFNGLVFCLILGLVFYCFFKRFYYKRTSDLPAVVNVT
ncbi:Non-specific serine/threonine protein kinase protein [Dioscorea alata]|uniref:Non-specific serine/threonine protein kinase protein n=1 Tax=Dioscorea alata TaxID=55571 RepID=A0ACB7VFE1_DIOAL|nr:Non-specific serine/threonine protein kinase protein [Dioscorea alata]